VVHPSLLVAGPEDREEVLAVLEGPWISSLANDQRLEDMIPRGVGGHHDSDALLADFVPDG
jgi:hypothetical protein